jgi:hypothetical protein
MNESNLDVVRNRKINLFLFLMRVDQELYKFEYLQT